MTKHALIIGISYVGTKMALPGVKNDVVTMQQIAQKWGFANENVTILSDNHTLPTAYNITQHLNIFCQKLKPGDIGIIYYSGHGMKKYSKEYKYEESCLVPIDHSKSGMINSESIRYYLNKIDEGINVMCIFDCCNSGTVCNLKYHMFDTSYRKDVTVKLKHYNPSDYIVRQKYVVSEKANVSKNTEMETDANIISISGCWDTQVSYDLGRNGALTLALINTLNANTLENLNLEKLLLELRSRLIHIRVKQTPQMMMGTRLEPSTTLKDFLRV